MRSALVFGFLSLLILTPPISAEFGFINPTLPQLVQELFDNKPSSFILPNKKEVTLFQLQC